MTTEPWSIRYATVIDRRYNFLDGLIVSDELISPP